MDSTTFMNEFNPEENFLNDPEAEDSRAHNGAEDSAPGNEGGPLTISDGMDPVVIPERITKENFAAIFGGRLPDGLDPTLFEQEGGLELAE